MSDKHPNLDSLFLAASEIESAEERAAFLDKACGENTELRQQVEQLLQSDDQAGSFLNKPPAELDVTLVPDSSADQRAASLQAGLAAAFGEDQSVIMGSAGHSVLKSLSETVNLPRVVLHDEDGEDPIVRPRSPEIPASNSDSRYQLQGEIARGGMGAILKGRDTDLGRELAIKVLLDAHKDNPQVIQRFIEEAQIGGQLQHPGIAPIFELGQFADKRPFFAMKLVKGQTLAKLLADRKSAADERGKFIGIFEQICQTMAYAHSRGVIHRDLKPANIMVGAFGEVQVMDWGLAKVLSTGGVADEKRAKQKQQDQSIIQTMRSTGSDIPGSFGSAGSETQMGSVMGTPAYMPPEQALGEIDQLDQRADVFGLGAILTEILTGKPPYVADNGTQVYRMASRSKLDDAFARLENSSADEDLIRLAKLCLERDPNDRPRDAGALSERVTGYLESVESKLRDTELRRAAEAARVVEQKKRTRVTMALAASMIFTITLGAAGWIHLNQKRSAALAEATQKAEERLNNARVHLAIADEIDTSDDAEMQRRIAELEFARRSVQDGIEFAAKTELNSLSTRATDQFKEIENKIESTRKAQQRSIIDRKLVAELHDIRFGRSESWDLEGVNFSETAARYKKAFKDNGFDIENDKFEELKLNLNSSLIRESLVAALDDWTRSVVAQTDAINVPTASSAQTPSFVLADALDPDPWRRQIRAAVVASDVEKLRALVCQGEFRTQSPSFVAWVCSVLSEKRMLEDSLRLLRQAIVSAPNDYWLNQELGTALKLNGQGKEAIIYFQACVSARPQYLPAIGRLATELSALKFHKDAEVLARRMIQLDHTFGLGHRLLASALRQQGRIEELRSTIQIWINTKPTDFIGNLFIALTLNDLGDKSEAIVFCQKMESIVDRKDVFRLTQLSQMFFDVGLEEKATSVLDLTIGLKPDSVFAATSLADLQIDLKQLESAERTYDEAIKLYPESSGGLYRRLGILRSKLGRLDEAIDSCRKAVEIDATARNYDGLAQVLSAAGKLDEAIEACEQAVAVDPKYSTSLQRLGYIYENLRPDDFNAAIAYRRLVDAEPNSSLYRSWLAKMYLRLGRHENAIREYGLALKIDPKNTYALQGLSSAHSSLGDVRNSQQNYDEAVAAYRKAIELDGSNANLRRSLGLILTKQGKPEEAIAEFDAAIKINPQDAFAHIFLGDVLRNKGLVDQAITAYQTAIKCDPKNKFGYINLGHAFQIQGRNDEAASEFKVAIEIDPTDKFARNALAWLWATNPDRNGQYPHAAEAVSQAQEAVRLTPNDAAFHNTLGVALYRTNNWAEATLTLQKSIELGSDIAHNWLFLAMSHWQLDQTDQAKEWYDKSLTWQTANEAAVNADTELQSFFAEAAKLMSSTEADENSQNQKTSSNSDSQKSGASDVNNNNPAAGPSTQTLPDK